MFGECLWLREVIVVNVVVVWDFCWWVCCLIVLEFCGCLVIVCCNRKI